MLAKEIYKNRFGFNKNKMLNDKNVFDVMNGKKLSTVSEEVVSEEEGNEKVSATMKQYKEIMVQGLKDESIVKRLENVLKLIDKIKSFKVYKDSNWRDLAKLTEIMPDLKSIGLDGIEEDLEDIIQTAYNKSGAKDIL